MPAAPLLWSAAAVAAPPRPHIVMHLIDDFGWANAGWHRPDGWRESPTPVMSKLAREGVELDRAYSYQFCSPSRCALQTGRLPVHVNTVNGMFTSWNEADPVSGFTGIPRNMTGVAEHLRGAGYRTHQVGKWDAGMATVDHTPRGRGYDSSLGYFSHANDYFDQRVNTVAGRPGSNALVDLWDTDGPATGQNSSCGVARAACPSPGTDSWYHLGPEELYEENAFVLRAVRIIAEHPAGVPLFLNYDSHLVHSPLQVPEEYFHRFDFVGAATPDWDYHRQLYAAMVSYLDDAVGRVVAALRNRSMWEDTLWVAQSDNGGPSFTGDNHTANNYPLRGSKYTNWEGGIRVNAFVSGGFLRRSAPGMVGKRVEGYTHVADWYATFCGLAGAAAVDERARRAGLPGIDSLDLWPYLTGAAAASPRGEIHADKGVLLQGQYKLIAGSSPHALSVAGTALIGGGCFPGPYYPNDTIRYPWPSADSTTYGDCAEQRCPHGGCLYDIFADPEERENLSGDPGHADVLHQMQARLQALDATVFAPTRDGSDTLLARRVAEQRYGGYWGPFLFP